MRIATILTAALSVLSTGVQAAQTYDGYNAFYAAQAGALFSEPIKHDNAVYTERDDGDLYTRQKTVISGKTARIRIADNHFSINGKVFKFAQATAFPGERINEIYPVDVDVFVAERAGGRPPVLCLEGQPNGSGEADRYEQIFLLIDPLGHNPTFLHLPSLLSSCRAIRVTAGGQIAFPKNSYLLDEAQDTRIGLRVSYFTFERGQFVPTNQETRLRFVSPENPFEFAPQD